MTHLDRVAHAGLWARAQRDRILRQFRPELCGLHVLRQIYVEIVSACQQIRAGTASLDLVEALAAAAIAEAEAGLRGLADARAVEVRRANTGEGG